MHVKIVQRNLSLTKERGGGWPSTSSHTYLRVLPPSLSWIPIVLDSAIASTKALFSTKPFSESAFHIATLFTTSRTLTLQSQLIRIHKLTELIMISIETRYCLPALYRQHPTSLTLLIRQIPIQQKDFYLRHLVRSSAPNGRPHPDDVGERYHDTPLSSRWTVGIPLRVKNRLAIEFMDSLPIDASYENFFEAVRRIEQLAKDAADQISDDEDTLDSISVDIALRWARDATSGLASLHRKVQWLATSVTALENAMTNPGLPAETVLGRQERTRYRRAWSHHFSIFEETRTDRSLITE
ncbi:hypothetical protein BJ546DRAFT_261413 [Cryomyces antarcticus]